MLLLIPIVRRVVVLAAVLAVPAVGGELATLRDVRLTHVTSLAGAIGSLTVDARLAPAGVLELLATPSCVGALPADVQAALTVAPRVYLFPGRVDLLPPAGRSVEVRLAPAASGGGISFVLSALERGAVAASPAALALARARTRCTRALPNLPFGVRLLSASALTGRLELSFAGQNASFSAIG